jgi:hypothetical protein
VSHLGPLEHQALIQIFGSPDRTLQVKDLDTDEKDEAPTPWTWDPERVVMTVPSPAKRRTGSVNLCC